MKRRLWMFTVWSNIFYIIPIAVAIYESLWVIAVLLTVLFICSTGFHLFKSKPFRYADQIASYLTLVMCCILIFTSNFSATYVAWLLFCSSSILGLYLRFFVEEGTRDDTPHGFWHLCAASSIAFSLIIFVS